jgi:hypothetical protein
MARYFEDSNATSPRMGHRRVNLWGESIRVDGVVNRTRELARQEILKIA